MSRLDWKEGGRFDRVREQQQLDSALRGYQNAQIEDSIGYFRYWPEHSQRHPVYDEPTGTGLVFHPEIEVPVLHATHDEGGNQDTATGFYTVDSLYVTASFSQLSRTGLTEADIHTDNYLRDRIFYDGRLFRVTTMHVTGQISDVDFIVSIEATEIKRDEYILDPQFKDLLPGQTVPDSPVGPIPENYVMPVVGTVGPPGPTGPPGPQGPPGPTGTGTGFVYTQSTPSTVWEITHNLGYDPGGISVEADNGDIWEPVVIYREPGVVVRLTFGDSVAGKAYLS
jgi:hypothetical protein